MGTANFHDAVEICCLLRQRGAQLGDGRQQLVLNSIHRRHVHGGGKHVVAGLAAVHVVIGVHQAPFPALAAQQLAGAVGQHLVDVHVGLRARAGLPHHQRKFARVVARNHLVGSDGDGLGNGRVLQAQRLVDHGRSPLHQRQRADDFTRLLFARDVEVLQRALRLRAPQLIGGDLDGAKGVAFGTGGHKARGGVEEPKW